MASSVRDRFRTGTGTRTEEEAISAIYDETLVWVLDRLSPEGLHALETGERTVAISELRVVTGLGLPETWRLYDELRVVLGIHP